MFRNIIEGTSTQEIYKISVDAKRGTPMVKDYASKTGAKADNTGVEIFFLNKNFAPTGYESDLEISDYEDQADTVKANEFGILKKLVSGTWGTDQVDETDLKAGDYLIAGTGEKVGKLVKAIAEQTTPYRYVGVYNDNGHTLYAFEIVELYTIPAAS